MTFEQYEEILTILETYEYFELSQALERTVGYDRERRLTRREKQLKRMIKQARELHRQRLWYGATLVFNGCECGGLEDWDKRTEEKTK
jgi:bisphosphoglycerate-independent phosphoglycerate mutase (AlkP superfamily)